MFSDETLRRVLPESAVALLGDMLRWMAWGVVFVVWVSFAQVYARMALLTLSNPTQSDFTIFYYTARMIADGLPMYGFSPSRYGITWPTDHLVNLNPPHFQILTWPLHFLTYAQALGVWISVSALTLGLAVALVARELRVELTWPRFFVCGAATLSAAPFTTVAVTCEMTFLLMPLYTLLWMAWRKRRWRAVGVWLGVCASFKLFMLLFVPYLLWRRRWNALGAMTIAATALVIAGCVAFGVDTYAQWLRSLGKVGWWWLPMNASWQGFVARVFQGGGTKVAPLVHMASLVPIASLAGAGILGLCALARVIRTDERDEDGDRDFLTLLLGALLASPLGWVYYLPLAYGPIVGWLGVADGWIGLRRLVRPQRAMVACGIVLLYVPHEVAALGQPSALATLTLASVYFWGVSLLWTASLTARRSSSQ